MKRGSTYIFMLVQIKGNGDIIWAGNTYVKMPILSRGFAFQEGQLPRPTLTISNALQPTYFCNFIECKLHKYMVMI